MRGDGIENLSRVNAASKNAVCFGNDISVDGTVHARSIRGFNHSKCRTCAKVECQCEGRHNKKGKKHGRCDPVRFPDGICVGRNGIRSCCGSDPLDPQVPDPVSVLGGLAVNGDSSVSGDATVAGAASFLGDATVAGAAAFLGDASIAGNATIEGSVIVTGTTVVDSIKATCLGVTGCLFTTALTFDSIRGSTTDLNVTNNIEYHLDNAFFFTSLVGSPSGTRQVFLPETNADIVDGCGPSSACNFGKQFSIDGVILALSNNTDSGEDISVRANGGELALLEPGKGKIFIRGESSWAAM